MAIIEQDHYEAGDHYEVRDEYNWTSANDGGDNWILLALQGWKWPNLNISD